MQNCDVQYTDKNGKLIYDFFNANRGTAPCRLQVLNNGTVVIIDAVGVTWSINGAPAPPFPGSASLLAGQTLSQVCSLHASYMLPCCALPFVFM